MSLFKKKEEHLSICEYDVININHYALSRGTVLKRNQLSALFVLIKNKYQGGEYSIDTPLKTFNIPEEFEAPEIMTIAKFYEATAWHIFIDEERYVDINFDQMEVNGEPDMLEFCKEAVRTVEKFKSDIRVTEFSFNKYPGWLWDKFLEEQYEKIVALGNRYLKYGDFYIYNDELDESKIANKEEFEKARNREYILLKSKINSYRIILVDINIKQVLATELDDLEKEYLSDILKPQID